VGAAACLLRARLIVIGHLLVTIEVAAERRGHSHAR
jgi:hypothetical protein